MCAKYTCAVHFFSEDQWTKEDLGEYKELFIREKNGWVLDKEAAKSASVQNKNTRVMPGVPELAKTTMKLKSSGATSSRSSTTADASWVLGVKRAIGVPYGFVL